MLYMLKKNKSFYHFISSQYDRIMIWLMIMME